MSAKIYLLVLFYVYVCVQSDDIVRVKRFNFFSGPTRYYRRPIRQDFPPEIYSNTPPPNYTPADDEYRNGPDQFRMKMIFNKKPERNLDDEQVINLFKNLSKGDLNRILDLANEKEKLENFNKIPIDNNIIGSTNINYKSPNYNSANINKFNYMMSNNNPNILYTTGQNTKEEMLPRPINLRDEFDYAVSFTNNAPSYAKPNYKVENFGDLPLEENKSKPASVSSYHVPHYSVISTSASPKTSPSSSYSGSSRSIPDIEAAPSPKSSAARAESDAHLKAIKIWTHESKGAAYYLHSDGTLSLEKHKTK